jgi:hypothetical protein
MEIVGVLRYMILNETTKKYCVRISSAKNLAFLLWRRPWQIGQKKRQKNTTTTTTHRIHENLTWNSLWCLAESSQSQEAAPCRHIHHTSSY